MNVSIEDLAQRSPRGIALNAKQASETDAARSRIESLIEQTHEAIQTLSVRLEPVLHKSTSASTSQNPEQAPCSTPAHEWLVDRETRLRDALHRLHDLIERLEV